MKLYQPMFALALLACAVSPAAAAEDPRVAAEVMALTKAQWAAEMAGKPAADQMAATADDYSEFNGQYLTRIDGKAMAAKMADALDSSGDKPVIAEMQNPRVQVHGDTAVLTYNYAGMNRTKDGKVEPAVAKSTRVYAKQGGQWKLVHAHFSQMNADD